MKTSLVQKCCSDIFFGVCFIYIMVMIYVIVGYISKSKLVLKLVKAFTNKIQRCKVHYDVSNNFIQLITLFFWVRPDDQLDELLS